MARRGSSQHTTAGKVDAPPALPKPLDRPGSEGPESPAGVDVRSARRQLDHLQPELLLRERRPVHVGIGSGPAMAADLGAFQARSVGPDISISRQG